MGRVYVYALPDSVPSSARFVEALRKFLSELFDAAGLAVEMYTTAESFRRAAERCQKCWSTSEILRLMDFDEWLERKLKEGKNVVLVVASDGSDVDSLAIVVDSDKTERARFLLWLATSLELEGEYTEDELDQIEYFRTT